MSWNIKEIIEATWHGATVKNMCVILRRTFCEQSLHGDSILQAAVQTLNMIKLQLHTAYGPETEIFQHCAQQLCYNVILVGH